MSYWGVLPLCKIFHDEIKKFTDEICNQIRCKKVHEEITSEIKCHILDQKESFEQDGFSEQEATQQAIFSMGNAIEIGQKLDGIHRPKPNWTVLILTAIIICTGFFARFFMFPDTKFINNFFIYTIFGLLVFCIAYFMDYTILEKQFKLFLGVFLLFSLFVFSFDSPFIFHVNGAKHFLNTELQGHHILLLFLPLFAVTIYKLQNKGLYGIFLCGIVYFCFFLLGINSPTSTGILIATFTCLIILTVAIFKNWFGGSKSISLLFVYIPVFLSFLLFVCCFVFLPSFHYRFSRLSLFIRPELDPMGAGYQGTQFRQVLSHAQFWGQSSYTNFEKYLPDYSSFSNDYMLVRIIGKYGYCIGILFIILFAVLFYFMFRSTFRLKNRLGFLIALICCLSILFQVIFYLLPNLGIVFIAPKFLPFVSNNFSGFLVNMFLMGLACSAFKNDSILFERKNKKLFSPFFQYKDGKIIIDINPK